MDILERNKKFLGVFCIIGWLFLFSLLLHFLWMRSFDAILYFSLLCGVLSLFVFLMIFSWQTIGLAGAVTFCILSSLAAFAVSIGAKEPSFNLFILLYILTILTIDIFLRKEKSIIQTDKVVFEDLEEGFNSLFAENQKHLLQTEALNKKYYRYLNLKTVVELLSSSLSLPEVVHVVVDKTFELIGKSENCFFYLVDREKQKLALAGFKTTDGEFLKIKSKEGDLFDERVVKIRQPLIVQDFKKDYRFGDRVAKKIREDLNSLISAPLVSSGKIIGVLRLDSSQTNSYLEDDLRLLHIIADLAAVAVENAVLYQRTVELAITDSLTGLYVHRYFMERLTEEVHRSGGTKSHLSLVMCDIDDFKKYNDEYGHAAGDMVLKGISLIIKKCTQGGDFIARYGGEEFALFLPNQNRQAAFKIAEKIRKEVAGQEFNLRRKKTGVSVSIGIASFPEDGVMPETLIKEADLALYRAKQEGKNRVCSGLI